MTHVCITINIRLGILKHEYNLLVGQLFTCFRKKNPGFQVDNAFHLADS